jgi:hypothetical protein
MRIIVYFQDTQEVEEWDLPIGPDHLGRHERIFMPRKNKPGWVQCRVEQASRIFSRYDCESGETMAYTHPHDYVVHLRAICDFATENEIKEWLRPW